jgi:hypothetical protein
MDIRLGERLAADRGAPQDEGALPVAELIQFYQDLASRHRVMPPHGATTRPFNVGGAALWATSPQVGADALKDVSFP